MLLDARYNPDTRWRSSSGTENMLFTGELAVIVGHLKKIPLPCVLEKEIVIRYVVLFA